MVKFNPSTDIPSLKDKVILVTGGNIGLGYESILQLSQHSPAHIYLAARSEPKAVAAIKSLRDAVPNGPPISFLPLDLSSFASIKSASKSFTSSNSRLDILMENAGVMACPPGLTSEGYELQFGTNHLGHALLTHLLLPTLRKTAAAGADVRVVTLSSSANHWAPKQGYLFDALKTDMKGTSTWARYGQSKLANIHYTSHLAAKYPDLTFVSVHPGSVATNLITAGPATNYPLLGWLFKLSYLVQVSVQEGAWGQLWAATGKKADESKGEEGVKQGAFYYPFRAEGKGSKLVYDKELERKLSEWTEKELEGHY